MLPNGQPCTRDTDCLCGDCWVVGNPAGRPTCRTGSAHRHVAGCGQPVQSSAPIPPAAGGQTMQRWLSQIGQAVTLVGVGVLALLLLGGRR